MRIRTVFPSARAYLFDGHHRSSFSNPYVYSARAVGLMLVNSSPFAGSLLSSARRRRRPMHRRTRWCSASPVPTSDQQFRSLTVSNQGELGLLVDAQHRCHRNVPAIGAMGVHYFNRTLTFVGDGEIQALTPERFVYDPDCGWSPSPGRSRVRRVQGPLGRPPTPRPRFFGQRFRSQPSWGSVTGCRRFYHCTSGRDSTIPPAGIFACEPDVT